MYEYGYRNPTARQIAELLDEVVGRCRVCGCAIWRSDCVMYKPGEVPVLCGLPCLMRWNRSARLERAS